MCDINYNTMGILSAFVNMVLWFAENNISHLQKREQNLKQYFWRQAYANTDRSQQHETRDKKLNKQGFSYWLAFKLIQIWWSSASVDFWPHVVSMLGRSEVIIHLNWTIISISMNSHLHHLYNTALLCRDWFWFLKVFLVKSSSTKGPFHICAIIVAP